MPRRGLLVKNLNLSLEALSERISPLQQDTIYSYVVTTVKHRKGRFYQKGSGPNFQGDLVTLCSCKHYMRTFRGIVQPRKGVWIAGFTSRTYLGSHKLFYLMKVAQAFKSQREFSQSDSISEEAKNAKVAHLDRFGDIYQPKSKSGDPYCHTSYFRPHKNHVHREPDIWHKDINYVTRYGRRPGLLVGHQKHSFLWDRPVITLSCDLPRSTKKTTDLSDFIGLLLNH